MPVSPLQVRHAVGLDAVGRPGLLRGSAALPHTRSLAATGWTASCPAQLQTTLVVDRASATLTTLVGVFSKVECGVHSGRRGPDEDGTAVLRRGLSAVKEVVSREVSFAYDINL